MNQLPAFRDHDDPRRKNPFGWDYGHGKSRKRKTFPTKKAKKEFKEAFERKYYTDRDALVSFNSEKWRKFLEFEKMAGGMKNLEEAARNASQNDHITTLTLEEMAKLKVEDKKRSQDIEPKRVETHCGRFLAAKGNKNLSMYTRADCQGWIDDLAQSQSLPSLKNHHKSLASVFNMAVKLGYLNRSPAQYVKFPSGRGEKRIELFEAKDVQKLLDHIWEQNKPLAGVYAILFFTGMRVSMVAPSPSKRAKNEFITPEMINVKDKEIIIPPGIMKYYKTGLVIDEKRASNLWPWLVEIENAKIPEPAQTFNKRRRKLCAEVGLEWPANVHRRSCASYYAALHGKSPAAELLGNTEEMIADHYQVATFAKKAEPYFKVLPKLNK